MSVGPCVSSARVAIVLTMVLIANGSCDRSAVAPTPPVPAKANLTGRWVGRLDSSTGGPEGLGDWSRLVLTLQPNGGGDLVTNDGQRFSITNVVDSTSQQRVLQLVLPPHDSCVSVVLVIRSVQVDKSSAIQGFSGSVSGRWCNTLVNTFTFAKG